MWVADVGVVPNQMGTVVTKLSPDVSVDHEGNMWVADVGVVPNQMGTVVTKLSPDGEVLMTLGTIGVTGRGPDTFNQPTGVAVAPFDTPPRNPGSLSTDEYVDILASFLSLTQYPAGGNELPADPSTLRSIRVEDPR